jgi:SAM-dependent methyltransferase
MKSNLRASQYADIVAGDLQKMGKDICDGPILDVGCASGEFLNALATEYKVDPKNLHGIEPSRLAAKYARENHGCKVWDNFAEEVDWTKKPAAGDSHFKYVFLLNSLEHLYEPAKVLDGIHHALGRDGLLGVFTVPNVHSLAGRMFPLGFMAKNFLDAQDHFFFSLETLVKFMDYHGFQLCITEDMDNPFGRRRNIVAKDEVEKAARWLAFNCGVPRHELYGPDTLLPAWIERLDAMGADDREACDLTKGAIEGLKNHLADCVGDESLYESVVDFWRDNIWPQPDLSEACGAWFQPKVGQRSRS